LYGPPLLLPLLQQSCRSGDAADKTYCIRQFAALIIIN